MRPPGSEDFEASAVAWLDVLAPDFRRRLVVLPGRKTDSGRRPGLTARDHHQLDCQSNRVGCNVMCMLDSRERRRRLFREGRAGGLFRCSAAQYGGLSHNGRE